jgi:8-oxo-dGTP diphosphatase
VTLADRYPLLHKPTRWEWGGLDVRFCTDLPPDELVTNIHVICFVGTEIVLCRDDRDIWIVPGGTREPRPGAHHTTTDRPAPHYPWQPHPHKAWLWCTADVVLESEPTNPEDAENILEVRAFAPEEAMRLSRTDGDHMAELLALAIEFHRDWS